MRDLVRQIIAAYNSTKLEGQEDGVIVFSGREPSTKQAVRIQILPRLMGNDREIGTRFRALAQAIRQLNHPNVVSVQAVAEKSGLPYIVSRALEKAQPLATRLDQPWAVDAAADVVMQAGQALEHAYNKGIVHGSLSPQSVMVQENGQVKVTDFGLGQLLDLLGAQARQAASPFVAPERSGGQKASARADVYSLAAILYTLLARRPPQSAKGQILPPGRFNSDVPPAMDQVLVRALSSDPKDRYPDVKSFLAALGAVALVAPTQTAETVTPSGRCARCGARNQTGRFCRKCGSPLLAPESSPVAAAPAREEIPAPPEPAQATGDRPAPAISGEYSLSFPEPLPMPRIDLDQVWATLAAETRALMPEPPPLPVLDRAEAAPAGSQVPATQPSGQPDPTSH